MLDPSGWPVADGATAVPALPGRAGQKSLFGNANT